ncbi:hypothetical protein BUALT_Bualt12G0066500 [Buddleja alternifolia]|uniref:Transposase n=1 Tax=Buddleja alternifolia TaxID=168488 RepID=A0AAV6WPD1_9LAMI|nr:hypothetical protein BUALT_Bualt12G0066500 [Buddleja alternifolia]
MGTSMTLAFHYGGKFCASPVGKYIGGKTVKLDYVNADTLCKKKMDKLTREIGLTGDRRYYIITNNVFKLLYSDIDMKQHAKLHISTREMNVYVEFLAEPENSEGDDVVFLGEDIEVDDVDGEDVGGVGEDERNSSGDVDDSDDLLDSDYYMKEEWIYVPEYTIGMQFSTEKEFRRAVQSHSVNTRRTLKTTKNDGHGVYVRCVGDDYELRRTNPGFTIILGTEDDTEDVRFSKFYACFKALKQGFLTGCRPIVGMDGCHLNVGVDPNNNLYPIAWAVVFKENKETCLILAFEEVFPRSDHRFCVRHLLNNFKIVGYRGLAFKNTLWSATKATTINGFKLRMQELRQLDESVEEWFHHKPPVQWTRSHFSEYPKCGMLLNNFCEVFNSNILDAREKSIITMLEWIRQFLMKRLHENRDRAEAKWKSRLCPKISTIIEKKWGLSGIPCKHAISAIFDQRDVPEDYVDECYSVDTYKRVYAPGIMGINGSSCVVILCTFIHCLQILEEEQANMPKQEEWSKVRLLKKERREGEDREEAAQDGQSDQSNITEGQRSAETTNQPVGVDNAEGSQRVEHEDDQPMVADTIEIEDMTQSVSRRPGKEPVSDYQTTILPPSRQSENPTILPSSQQSTQEPEADIETNFMTPRGMFQRQTQPSGIHSRVQIRAPPPMTGSTVIPSRSVTTSQQSSDVRSFIVEGGQRYVSISNPAADKAQPSKSRKSSTKKPVWRPRSF